MKRETRNLQHEKGGRIREVNYLPIKSDGQDGDARIYKEDLYIKTKGSWLKLMSGDKIVNQEITRNVELIISEGASSHAALSGVTANQHHNQAHAIDGSDHTGTLTVAKGGTGLGTVAADRLLTGNGTGALTAEANLVYTSTGLGIGTAVPDSLLDIHGAQLANDSVVANENMIILEKAENAPVQRLRASIGIQKWESSSNNGRTQLNFGLHHNTAEVNVMSLRSNGYVGIGTTHPSSPLSVENAALADGGVLAHFFDGTMADTDFFTINIGKSAGSHNCGVIKYSYTSDGHTGNYISLGLKTTEDTLTITSDARVGIGTSSPGELLSVEDGSITMTNTNSFTHGLTAIAATDGFGLFTKTSDTGGGLNVTGLSDDAGISGLYLKGYIGIADPDNHTPAIEMSGAKKSGTGATILGSVETVLQVLNYTTELVTVLGGGNVGIGTTTPYTQLEIAHATNPVMSLHREDVDVNSGDSLGIIGFTGADNSADGSTEGTIYGAMIKAVAKDDWSSGDSPTEMQFHVSPDAGIITQAMVIDKDGKVGIGTASPISLLTVNAGIATAVDKDECPRISFYNNANTELVAGDFLGRLTFGAREYTSDLRLAAGYDGIGAYIAAVVDDSWTSSPEGSPARLQFHVENVSGTSVVDTPAMVIKSNGNVGIGTSSPDGTLDVSSTNAEIYVKEWSSSQTTPPEIKLQKNKGTAVDGSNSSVLDNTELGKISFWGWNDVATANQDEGASIFARVNGTPTNSNTDMPTELVFCTTAEASATPTERMYISSAGNVGIGIAGPDRTLDVLHASSPQLRLTNVDGTKYVDFQADSSGDLTIDPIGDDIFIGGGSNIGTADYASQLTGWRIDDPGGADFRYLFVDEMHAKHFIADLETALAGGQIIAKSVAVLHSDYSLPAAGANSNFTVKDLPSAPGMGVFVANDWIRFRVFTRPTSGNPSLTIADAWGQVTAYNDNEDGTQTWTFTRPADAYDGTASGTVKADAIILDYGASGNGYYEVNAIDGAAAVNSPYSQIVTWAGSNGPGESGVQKVRTRFGNLGGLAVGATNEFGIVAGDELVASGTDDPNAAQYIKAGSTGVTLKNCDINILSGAATVIKLNHTLPALGIGTAASLTALPTGSEKGFWVGQQGSGNYDLFLGDEANTRLVFDDSAGKLIIYSTDALRTEYTGSAIEFWDTTKKMSLSGTDITMYDDSTNVISTWVGSTITLGKASNEHIEITSSSMKFNDGDPDDGGTTMMSLVTGDLSMIGKINITSIGSQNVMIGSWSTTNPDVSGVDFNVCIGEEVGKLLEDGAVNNVMIGRQSGIYLTTGTGNTFLGVAAGYGVTGNSNIAIGHSSLVSALNRCTGSDNIAIGRSTMPGTTSGSTNISIGEGAGVSVNLGSRNIMIGDHAHGADEGISPIAVNEQISIGYSCATSASEQMRIGDAAAYVLLDFSSDGVHTLSATSDVRIKKDIVDTDLGLSFINALRPVKYKGKNKHDYPDELFPEGINVMKRDTPRKPDPPSVLDGFIGQEVKEVMDNLGVTFSGWHENPSSRQMVSYSTFVVPLVKAVQELSAKVTALEAQIN
tara:strand:+ start:3241 stop:7953 length:4713 start_codon:yes stop_codon:yes gene_type:complete